MKFVATFLLAAVAFDASAEGPKNVILMIGDGMGYNHVHAGSLYQHGAEKAQPYWQWVHVACSTHSANNKEGYVPDKVWNDFKYFMRLPTDSAAGATTLGSGVKTMNGAIGVGPDKEPVRMLVDDAEELGKATGILSTVRFTHATPAAFGARNASRGHEKDIARDMILENGVDLILAPGHPEFDADAKRVPEPDYEKVGGADLWEQLRAGAAGGDANGDGTPDPWHLIETAELARVTRETGNRIFALLPVSPTLQVARGGNLDAPAFEVPFTPGLPTMADMMETALDFLAADEDGFFLMAEGGAIDWAAHDNKAGRLVEEQIDFDKAIEATAAWVEKNSSWDETLVIVTADHECGYLLGPESDPDWKPLENNGKGQMPGMQFYHKSHTNQLVPLFAKGAGADSFLERAVNEDPRLGKYVDNTDVAAVVREVWR